MSLSPETAETLTAFVFKFRKAIEAAQANGEAGEFFRKFPVAQCGNASDMLAQFLIDNGIGPIAYVSGTFYGDAFDDRQSHAWLLVNGLVVDITGDQFQNRSKPLKCNVPVYIGPMTKYCRFFEIDPSGISEHHGLECNWSNYHELKTCYETILKYLP